MVKITTKLYRPSDLLEVINAMETVLASHDKLTASDIVIDLRKKGYKIVKVDDGIKPN
jgi:soluble P-type ATPase